jgi:hypothetical protein
MRLTKLSLGIVVASLSFQLLITHSVWAASSCGSQETALVACSSESAVWGVLLTAINVLTACIGVVAVGGIVYGAFLYASSGQDAAQTGRAKDVIRNVIIGLLLFAGMYAILQFLVPGGVFNRDLAQIGSEDPDFASNISDGKTGGGLSSNDGTPADTKEASFTFATYNVLGFDHDTSASKYSNDQRMQKAANLLKTQSVDVAVLNEINASAQRTIILNNLNGWKGTGLVSGNQDVIVIWNSDVFSLEGSGTYAVPVIPGRPHRPQPWAKLRHKESKRILFVYGLHLSLDNTNQKEGAKQALEHMKQRKASEGSVFIVAGDMNSNDGADRVTYNVFKTSKLLHYARERTANKKGDNCDTHHSLGSQDCRPTRGSHIDQVWYSNDQNIKAESYSVIANSETAHISDHNPLIVSLKVPAPKK